MNYLSSVALIFLLLACSISNANALFGNKKRQEEKAAEEARKSIKAGIDTIRHTATNPHAMKETMQMMKDPETMKEVEKMMKDPAFIKEMDRLKSDPNFMRTAQSAKELYNDPEKAAQILSEMQDSSYRQQFPDAEQGMTELAKAAKNPKMLAEAMEMMKDPKVAAQVKAMMNDPSFKEEMQKLTDNPNFKAAMGRAKEDIAMISSDPAKMKLLHDYAKKMKGGEL